MWVDSPFNTDLTTLVIEGFRNADEVTALLDFLLCLYMWTWASRGRNLAPVSRHHCCVPSVPLFCASPALVYIPGGWPLQDVSSLLSASQIALISLFINKFLFLPSLSLPSFPTFLFFSSFLPFFFPLAAFSPSETGGWQERRSQVLMVFPLWCWLCLFLSSSFQWTSPI